MSEEPQGGMRQPFPASQPPQGHDLIPERFTDIPGQEESLLYHQPNIHSHHHHQSTISPFLTEGVSRLPGPFPPPQVNPHNLSILPPHYLGHPPPMFSRPPPPMPPKFSQPPPAMPHKANIPHEAALQPPPMTVPVESSQNWHQHNPLPIPQCSQVPGPSPNTSNYSKGTGNMWEEEGEELKWLKEFEKKVMSCLPPSPSPLTESTITNTNTRMDVKVTTTLVIVIFS